MKTTPFEFETARLAFRVWQERHRAPFGAMNADPQVMRYFPSLQSQQQSDASVDMWLQQFAEQGWSNWAVELKSSGIFIGFIGLTAPQRPLPFSPCVEIGWRLTPTAWSQGFATEGARACLRLGFERLGLTEIVSFTALLNRPSIAVMERIGMRNADADFLHPALASGHELGPHCLYRIRKGEPGRAR
jgi:RimJ/RimL family protein N-acetyltransferase